MDTAAMLDATDPDVLCVCTPSGTHLDVVTAAADRGINVLCEKPLEITTDQIDNMTAVVDDAGVALGGIFHQWHDPVIRTVYDAAREGRFGTLSVASSYVPWWREDDYYAPDRWQGTRELDDGGALMDQLIHGVNTI